jgi:hypothetical protein
LRSGKPGYKINFRKGSAKRRRAGRKRLKLHGNVRRKRSALLRRSGLKESRKPLKSARTGSGVVCYMQVWQP